MRTYRELFAVAEFRALFTVQCLTVAAASVAGLALGTITFASTGSPLLTSLAVFGGPVLRLGASWFLGSVADLVRPRPALVLLAVLTSAVDAVQSIPDLAPGLRFVLLALPWVLASATGGSMMALVSDLLPPGAFVFGRATINLAVGVTQIAGYALAGLLLHRTSTTGLFAAAAAASGLAALVARTGIGDHPARAGEGAVLARSHRVNSSLLGSPVLRPVLLALWVPNGLVVGCESLFIPAAGGGAGLLFAVTAAGMLTGDVVVGRYLPDRSRGRLVGPLRVLLAAPYLVFLLHPRSGVALAAAFVASTGYAAALPLQERLVRGTSAEVRGQVLGLNSAGVMGMQGIGAALAGGVAQVLGAGAASASTAIGVMAIGSLLVTACLTPGLRRSRPRGGGRWALGERAQT